MGEVREPLPVRPGSPAIEDSEYTRGGLPGVADLFMAFKLPAGRREVEVTPRKTSRDFARFLQQLSNEHSPEVETIVLVVDNLSTHTPAAFYEAFEPAEAQRLKQRYEWHDPPPTRQLAQHGRDGAEHLGPPVPRPPHPR